MTKLSDCSSHTAYDKGATELPFDALAAPGSVEITSSPPELFLSSPSLRIDDPVQVECWRPNRGLTQHNVHLPAMVRLVVEQMTAGHVRRLHVVFALIIRVSERPAPKSGIEPCEQRFNPRVFPHPRAPQTGELIIQNLV